MNGLGKRFRTSILEENNWISRAKLDLNFLTTYRQIKFAILVTFEIFWSLFFFSVDTSSFIILHFFLSTTSYCKKANYSRTSTNGHPFRHRLRAVSFFLEHFVENCGKTQNKRWSVTVTVTTLLAARGTPLARHAHSHVRTLTCFVFFPAVFRGKERPLAVYFRHTTATLFGSRGQSTYIHS